MTTVPEVGRSRPARQCIRVDLPEPDGPMIAVSPPAGNATEIPSSAFTAASPSPNVRCRSVALTMTLVGAWVAVSLTESPFGRWPAATVAWGPASRNRGSPQRNPGPSRWGQPGGASTVGGTSATPSAR